MSQDCHFYLPPLIVIAIFAGCYYVYVISFCTFIIESYVGSVFYILGLNIFFFMAMWSYFVALFTPKATVPEIYALTSEDFALLNDEIAPLDLTNLCDLKNLEVIQRTPRGHIRAVNVFRREYLLYQCKCMGEGRPWNPNEKILNKPIIVCKICKVIKPDRAHHCAKCKTCILRMDHHCPWLKNCICFTTQKYFLLTLLYTMLLCIYYVGTTLEYFLNFWDFGENLKYMPIMIGFIVAALFGFLIGIFLMYHFGALLRNETNIERLFPNHFIARHLTFDIGAYNNFKEIFGEDWRYWLFPVYTTKGNGCDFPYTIQTIYHQRHSSETSMRTRDSRTSQRSNIPRQEHDTISDWSYMK